MLKKWMLFFAQMECDSLIDRVFMNSVHRHIIYRTKFIIGTKHVSMWATKDFIFCNHKQTWHSFSRKQNIFARINEPLHSDSCLKFNNGKPMFILLLIFIVFYIVLSSFESSSRFYISYHFISFVRWYLCNWFP